MKTRIKDLGKFEGQSLELKGWVHQIRSSGQISFIVLRDGSGYCQCVFSKDHCKEEIYNPISDLTLETCLKITGKVRKWKDNFELQAHHMEIIHQSQPYPLGKKSHGPDFLLRKRHLWLRSKKQRALMTVRNSLIKHIHDFFQKESFLQIDAPLLTPVSCEGTSSLFPVDFFDETVYLSQSGQLYMEAAAAAYGNVYCFGPTFRAEKSSTRRHLLEFWMIEPEMAFYDLNQAMQLAENFLEYAIQNTLESCYKELKVLERDPTPLENIKAPFPRISYKEAKELLKNFSGEKEFGAAEETLISSQFKKPVFIHHYPKGIKAFYMKEDPENQELCLSFDLLATEGRGEIIGGGQREDSLERLEQEIQNAQLSKADFDWYLDLRRYGSFPHSGFGLGLERLVGWVCGLDHVRESIPFPRLYGRSFFEKPS